MHLSLIRLLAATAAAAALAGCASSETKQNTTFDLGPAVPSAAFQAPQPPLRSVVVSDATGSAALDTERMFYRLNYADPLQARSYANSRWNTSPLSMLTQRLKSRLAQAGAQVLSPTDASTGIPILRVEVDDFIHAFSGASSSEGRVVLRASLFRDHKLVDQKSFSRATPAGSANAAGGARALADSTDAVAADIVAWLSSLQLKQQ